MGPASTTFRRPSAPFFYRVRALSLGRPLPRFVYLWMLDAGCFAPPLLREPPLYPSYLGQTGLETKAETGGTGAMGCQFQGKRWVRRRNKPVVDRG